MDLPPSTCLARLAGWLAVVGVVWWGGCASSLIHHPTPPLLVMISGADLPGSRARDHRQHADLDSAGAGQARERSLPAEAAGAMRCEHPPSSPAPCMHAQAGAGARALAVPARAHMLVSSAAATPPTRSMILRSAGWGMGHHTITACAVCAVLSVGLVVSHPVPHSATRV